MVECAQCMFENAADAVSCEQCGAELTPEALSMQLGQVCRDCDSYNDPGVRVCVSCGTSLGGGDAAPEPAEAPAAVAPPAPAVETTPKPAPLPPGALPPGWTAYQRQGPPASTRPAPQRALTCPRCKAENPSTARFCGGCGNPIASGEAAQGKLILIRGLAGEGRQFPLSAAPTMVGREGAAAFPEDPYLARSHASFYFRGQNLVVHDAGALNGLYVKLREAHALRAGDMFVVGERLLRYQGVRPLPASRPGLHGAPCTADRLITVEEVLEGGGVGRICRRSGPVLTIGRAGCDLNFGRDGFVSARHAEISIAGETAFLRDLGSANGTFLRVPPRDERELQHGDYLLMGRELLRVEIAAVR